MAQQAQAILQKAHRDMFGENQDNQETMGRRKALFDVRVAADRFREQDLRELFKDAKGGINLCKELSKTCQRVLRF